MSDITLTVVAGPTVELTADAPGAVTVTVSSGGGGGVTDHGALTGLADDDHPQYVRGSLVDAAGDLLVGSAADTLARLPLGSAAQVLRVNAGATAPEWAAASAGAVSVIARTVLGSDTASVDFTSIPSTYENLMVSWVVRATSSASWSIMYCRMNGDTTANYEWSYHRQTGASGAQIQTTSGATGLYAALTVDDAGTSGFAAYGSMLFPGYARTVFNKTAVGSSAAQYGVGAGKSSVGDYNGTWVSTAAVNQLTFYPSSGNFKTGSVFTLYGIAGA